MVELEIPIEGEGSPVTSTLAPSSISELAKTSIVPPHPTTPGIITVL